MAKSKTEEKIDDMLARLEAREAAIEKREAAMSRQERGGGSTPRPYIPEERIRKVVTLARDYLKAHHYQAGSRDLHLIEAVAHALYAASEDRE